MHGIQGCVLTENQRFIFIPYVLLAVFCALRHTFGAYIIDVYNRTALSPKSLQASAVPEVAIGTAVHINLTGVTSLCWDLLFFHNVYFPLFSSFRVFRMYHPHLWFLSSNTSAMPHPPLMDAKHMWTDWWILFYWVSCSTDICKKKNNRYLHWIFWFYMRYRDMYL